MSPEPSAPTAEVPVAKPYDTPPTTVAELAAEVAQGTTTMALDEPPPASDIVAGEPVLVRGWAYGDAGAAEIEIVLDACRRYRARVGLPRPDLPNALGRLDARQAGFSAVVPEQDLDPGPHGLEVVVVGADGRRVGVRRTFLVEEPGLTGSGVLDTGERLLIDEHPDSPLAAEHMARYLWARELATTRSVLDAGCGAGYGAAILAASGARRTVGVDSHRAVLEEARRRYADVEFLEADLRALPLPDGSFDLVCCFEVIEHVEDPERALDELKRVLSPSGILLLSSPNRDVYPAGNPWHVHEYVRDELAGVLAKRFANVRLEAQQTYAGTVLGGEGLLGAGGREAPPVQVETRKIARDRPGEERYLLGVASESPLPDMPQLAILATPLEDYWRRLAEHWEGRALEAESAVVALQGELAATRGERDEALARLGDGPSGSPHPVETAHPRDGAPIRRSRRSEGPISTALQTEIEREPAWMYAWELGNGMLPPLIAPELPSIHHTRLEILEPPVRKALEEAGPDARVLDLATCEGWFAHHVLEWGASEVLGIDIREQNIRRAELMRDHFGIDRSRLRFRHASVYELTPEDIGSFDIVLNLGLLYHLEDPVGALRISRKLTTSVCIVETQLTEQRAPIPHGLGLLGQYREAVGSFAVYWEQDQDINPLASTGGVLSLIPNLPALKMGALSAGFRRFEPLPAAPWHNPQYRRGERFMAVLHV